MWEFQYLSFSFAHELKVKYKKDKTKLNERIFLK